MTKQEDIIVAKITSPHGIKGQVKIISYCQQVEDIENYSCFFKDGKEAKIRISNKNKEIIGYSNQNDMILIAEIEGIKDRNEAEKLRNKEIFVKRDDFEELEDDEFYHADLIGLDVMDNGEKIGKILNIFDFGGGEMLEIEFLDGKEPKNCQKTENFAFKNEFFGKISVKEGFIEFFAPEIEEA